MTLQDEAKLLHPILTHWLSLYHSHHLSAIDLVGSFILSYISIRRGNKWISSYINPPISNDLEANDQSSRCSEIPGLESLISINYIQKKLGQTDPTIACIYNKCRLLGIKKNTNDFVNRVIVQWAQGNMPVILMTEIPTPMEVLRMQADGNRVVTMFTSVEQLSTCHVAKLQYMAGDQLHSRDPFEFLVHDIKHMYHFKDQATYDEQVGFFRAILSINAGKPKRFFCGLFPTDEMLWYELEYLISDMNCYLPHLMKYLLAKLLSAAERVAVQTFVSTAAGGVSSGDVCLSSNTKNAKVQQDSAHTDNVTFLHSFAIKWGSVLSALGMEEKTDSTSGPKESMCLAQEAYRAGISLLLNSYHYKEYIKRRRDGYCFESTDAVLGSASDVIDNCECVDDGAVECYIYLDNLVHLGGGMTPQEEGETLRHFFRSL